MFKSAAVAGIAVAVILGSCKAMTGPDDTAVPQVAGTYAGTVETKAVYPGRGAVVAEVPLTADVTQDGSEVTMVLTATTASDPIVGTIDEAGVFTPSAPDVRTGLEPDAICGTVSLEVFAVMFSGNSLAIRAGTDTERCGYSTVSGVLTIEGAMPDPIPEPEPTPAMAPDSITGYIFTMEIEVLLKDDDPYHHAPPGSRFNEIQFLENGYQIRERSYINDKWLDWVTGGVRRWEYSIPEPSVGNVDVYNYSNDGSTPANMYSFTFADATSGTWYSVSHRDGIRWQGRGTFTLREVVE